MSIATEELLDLIDLVSQKRIDALHLNQNGVHIHIQLHGETTRTTVAMAAATSTSADTVPRKRLRAVSSIDS